MSAEFALQLVWNQEMQRHLSACFSFMREKANEYDDGRKRRTPKYDALEDFEQNARTQSERQLSKALCRLDFAEIKRLALVVPDGSCPRGGASLCAVLISKMADKLRSPRQDSESLQALHELIQWAIATRPKDVTRHHVAVHSPLRKACDY